MTSAKRSRATLAELLREIASRPDCNVLPARGPALVPRNVGLPDDLRQFHDLCGGALLFEDASFPRRICGPGDFVPASPRLLTPKVAQQVAKDNPADVTNNCYVIVDGGQGLSTEPHVVMDLAPQRIGRCYAAAWVGHVWSSRRDAARRDHHRRTASGTPGRRRRRGAASWSIRR